MFIRVWTFLYWYEVCPKILDTPCTVRLYFPFSTCTFLFFWHKSVSVLHATSRSAYAHSLKSAWRCISGLAQLSVDWHRFQWTGTGFSGLAQVSVDWHRFQWTGTGFSGLAQVSVNWHRFQWTGTDVSGLAQLSLDWHRFQWTGTGFSGLAQL